MIKQEYLGLIEASLKKAKEEWADAIAVLIRDMEEVDKC